MTSAPDVLVVGAGVIGLAVAWRCVAARPDRHRRRPRARLRRVRTAAGMLAPVTELHYGEQPLLGAQPRLRRPLPRVRRRARRGHRRPDIGYRALRHRRSRLGRRRPRRPARPARLPAPRCGRRVELLTGRECRRLEPALAPGLRGGLLAADDHQVDPRRLHAAPAGAARRRGVRVVRASGRPGRWLARRPGRPACARRRPSRSRAGQRRARRRRLVAPALAGLPAGVPPPVRPVKGQILRLRGAAGLLRGTSVRGPVTGSRSTWCRAATASWSSARLSEEAGFDRRPRAGAVYELLRDAHEVVPGHHRARARRE